VKALVIGYGSIGARHARVLEALGLDVGIVSRRPSVHAKQFPALDAALDKHKPEYVVVASATTEHAQALEQLASHRYAGSVLVEKPLFAEFRPIPSHGFRAAFVGYNLRFHPLIQSVREEVGSRRALSVNAYVGQYLPDWRPSADYRKSYSASRAQGGGALRDLSHELDYLAWMFGPWTRLAALGGRVSGLEIDSDDAYSILLETQRARAVSVSMNYLDKTRQRTLTVNLEGQTLVVDLVAGTLRVDTRTRRVELPADYTYEAQHRAVIGGEHDKLCTLGEGAAVVDTIVAVERAASSGKWVSR
jgi:predicted dehydrogenase